MSKDDLKQFLIQAKQNTYASGGESQAKVLSDGRKEYVFKQGGFEYIDRYKGHEKFAGKEEVFKNNKLIWQMEYQGRILMDKILADDIYSFLRKALKQISEDKPFRGPEKFSEGEYRYINNIKGNIEKLSGEEKIFYQKKLAYKLVYSGGVINN